jgi:hypothetical protein
LREFYGKHWYTFLNRIGQVITELFQQPWLGNPIIRSFSTLRKEHDQLLKTLHGFTEEVNLQYAIFRQNSRLFLIRFSLFKVIHDRQEVVKEKGNSNTEHIETGISM